MKKILFIIILVFLLSECKKSDTNNQTETGETENITEFENNDGNIDFTKMQQILDNSNELNVEVFFAIAVLSKKYILQYEGEAEKLSYEEQQSFYETKKKDFFNSIKYSASEYEEFMKNHIEGINEYQNAHPEIREYFTTIN